MSLPLPPVFAIGIITGIGAVVGWIVGAVVDIAAAVGAALVAVWAAIGPILVYLWNGLKFAWSDVIKPAWDVLKKWGEQVWQLYTDHVKPIVDYLQGILKTLRKVYQTFIAPIRDMLSILEQFLQLTGLAHTVFGAWLDGELHRVDGVLARMWQELTKPINLLLHLVNEVILDARGILQAPLLLESTAHYMGYIASQWWSTSLTTIKTDWSTVLNQFHTGPRIQPSIDAGKSLIKDGSGPLSDAHAHGVAVFRNLVAENYQDVDYQINGVGPSEGKA